MKKLVFVSQRPLGPLMLAVHQLCVIGQALIVKDVLVQRISVVSCVKRTEEWLLSADKENAGFSKRIHTQHADHIDPPRAFSCLEKWLGLADAGVFRHHILRWSAADSERGCKRQVVGNVLSQSAGGS